MSTLTPAPFIPRIVGTRVMLREFERDNDIDALFALYADPTVTRWWSHEPWTEHQQAVDYIETRVHAAGVGVEFYPWVIASNADDALIGTITLFQIDRTHRRAMIGYALSPSMQGKGLARESLRVLLDFAWETLDLSRLEADTDPENAASCRLLERAGFKLEGSMRKRWFVHGAWHDTSWYALLREDDVARPDRRRDDATAPR